MHGSGVHTADRWSCNLTRIPDTGLALCGMDYIQWTSILPAGEMSLLMANTAAIRSVVIASQYHVEDDVCNLLQSQRRYQGTQDIGCSQHLGVDYANDGTDRCSD
jgi:hypothetical protein